MNMVNGDLPDDPSDEFSETCEGCDGSGIRCPAEPSCPLPQMPAGWVVVERCDYCEKYEDDLAAAAVVCDEAIWLRCESGGCHAVGRPKSPVHGD